MRIAITLLICPRECSFKRVGGTYPHVTNAATHGQLLQVPMAVAWTVIERKSKTMLRSNLEDIKSRFATLLQSVQSALEAD